MDMDIGRKKRMLLYCISTIALGERRKRRKTRTVWVSKILQGRREFGFYDNLVAEMRLSDNERFFNFTRLTCSQFEYILNLISPELVKCSLREPLPTGLRLAVTLRFLATGDSYPSLAYAFRIRVSTCCEIVHETCEVIWKVMAPIYLPVQNRNDYIHLAENFSTSWNAPNCVGAIDGKHVAIQAPAKQGSKFYNFKTFHSIILLAVVDANYKFTTVDIGAYGSQSDGGVLQHSEFGINFNNNSLDLPEDKPLINNEDPFPYYFIGDDAFPLSEHLMKPYANRGLDVAQRIFNYRISRARNVVERSFGILVQRWRLFRRVILAMPHYADLFIQSAVCLHNYLRHCEIKDNQVKYSNVDDITLPSNGAFRSELPRRLGARNATRRALLHREHLKWGIAMATRLCK